jgi:hypothetical protein
MKFELLGGFSKNLEFKQLKMATFLNYNG